MSRAFGVGTQFGCVVYLDFVRGRRRRLTCERDVRVEGSIIASVKGARGGALSGEGRLSSSTSVLQWPKGKVCGQFRVSLTLEPRWEASSSIRCRKRLQLCQTTRSGRELGWGGMNKVRCIGSPAPLMETRTLVVSRVLVVGAGTSLGMRRDGWKENDRRRKNLICDRVRAGGTHWAMATWALSNLG